MAKTTRVRKKKTSTKVSKKETKTVVLTHLTQEDFFISETLSRDLISAKLDMNVAEQNLKNLAQHSENLKLSFELNAQAIEKQKSLVNLKHDNYKAMNLKHTNHINGLKIKYELDPKKDVAYNDETLEIVRT